MRILIAYDRSPAAKAAIATAGALFAPAEAIVVNVRDPELHDVPGAMARVRLPDDVVQTGLAEIERRAADRAQRAVDGGMAAARDAGLEPVSVIRQGVRPWRDIERVAAEQQVDLVVCGTNGHSPIGQVFLGSTASTLLQHSPAPVLVVPAAFDTPSGPVVIGYDRSASARRALRFAAMHLRNRRAVVACVWRSPVRHSIDLELLRCLPSETVHDFIADFDAAYASEAEETAREGAEEAGALGMPAEPRTIESAATPWRALIQLAAEEHSTLIVTGSDRGPVTAALGSVSSGLVHHAMAAILLVPRSASVDDDVTAGGRMVSSTPT
jgi:nucleotide-binding universal stress UspA family protein